MVFTETRNYTQCTIIDALYIAYRPFVKKIAWMPIKPKLTNILR